MTDRNERRRRRQAEFASWSPRRRWVTLLVTTAVFLGLTALFTVIVSGAIWPGEAKVFERVLCSDERPEAVVVVDTYATSDGTSSNFTMYCTGPDGDTVDIGWARAWFLCWALHSVGFMGIIVVNRLRSGWRARAGGPTPDPRRDEGGAGRGPQHGGGGNGDAEGEPETLAELLDRDFPPNSGTY